MMNLNLITLIFVAAGSMLLCFLALHKANTLWQRIVLLCFLIGFFFYNGIAMASPEVPFYYLFYYFGLFLSFILAFKFFCSVFKPLNRRITKVLPTALEKIDGGSNYWQLVIPVYIILKMISLVYPIFRLELLLLPPSVDMLATWSASWEDKDTNIFLKLHSYFIFLLSPFFYIALYRYRNQFWKIVSILLFLLYVDYVKGAYIARSAILMTLGMIVVSLWVLRPHYRKKLVIIICSMLPVLLAGAYYYQFTRAGALIENISIADAIIALVEMETSFPISVGIPIIEGGHRVDFFGYVTWILTLPIPKVLTGAISGARINYEITEIVTGVSSGASGWSVVLPGLLSESVYVYGKYLFWLHGIIIGFFASLMTRIMENTPQLLFFQAYVVILLVYNLNRAGIGSVLPTFINEFILFYVFLLSLIFNFRLIPSRRQSTLAQN